MNWIDLVGDGTMLVSMRDMWAAYLVDIRTGKILWSLGGKHSSFTFGPGAKFEWQHDVDLQPGSIVTMFDDHCCQVRGADTYLAPTGASRGLVLKLDVDAKKATLVHEYGADSNLAAAYMGNTQRLDNGNVLVAWGSQPYLSEYSKSGKLLMYASFPEPNIVYRVGRKPWEGTPSTLPSGAARLEEDGKTTVYASWNGATDVASWRVLAGKSADSLSTVASEKRSGFETSVSIGPRYATFELEALDAHGQVLATSRPFTATR